jgi:hypothetical protein
VAGLAGRGVGAAYATLPMLPLILQAPNTLHSQTSRSSCPRPPPQQNRNTRGKISSKRAPHGYSAWFACGQHGSATSSIVTPSPRRSSRHSFRHSCRTCGAGMPSTVVHAI